MWCILLKCLLLSLVATYWITCMYVMIFVLLENKITTTTTTTHSFVSSWNSQFPQEPNVSLTAIDRSKAELLENLDLHLPYIDQSKFTWVHQLQKYLDKKFYKLPIVDVYPIFLANAFDVDVCVLDQIGSECVIHNFPSRGNNKSKPLYLHRINDDHFNGLKLTSGSEGDFLVNSSAKCSGSETPSISSKKKINPEKSHRFQYSGEFLKSLDSFQTIARATRKALFRNKIWKPKHDRTPVIVANQMNQPTLSLQRGIHRMRSDKVNKEVIVKPKENTVPVIIGNRKLPSRSKWRGTSQNSSLIQVTRDGTAEDKPGDGHIKVCTVNTQSITPTPYMVLPIFATGFAAYAGGIRVSFIQPRLF